MKNLFFAARPLITDFLGSIFFAILLAFKVEAPVAAAIGIAVSVAVILAHVVLRRASALQWVSLALVLLSGAATMFTHDPRFVMIKPTLVYIVVAAAMLQRGWMTRYVPPVAVGKIDDVTIVFGYIWAALMFVTAAANMVFAVWLTSYWGGFVGVFPLASKIALFSSQYLVSRSIARSRSLTRRNAPGGGLAAAGPIGGAE